jgi:hypothetical protein
VGITISEDEHDKKYRGMRETRKQIIEDHKHDTNTPQELMARTWQIDQTKLKNPNLEKAYHLVDRRKDGEIINKRRGQGYKITPASDETQLNGCAHVDESQVKGDLVLMETSAENYEKRRELNRKRAEFMYGQRIEETKEKINKMARDSGLVGRHKDAVIE